MWENTVGIFSLPCNPRLRSVAEIDNRALVLFIVPQLATVDMYDAQAIARFCSRCPSAFVPRYSLFAASVRPQRQVHMLPNVSNCVQLICLAGLAFFECIPRYSLISISVYRRYFLFLVMCVTIYFIYPSQENTA